MTERERLIKLTREGIDLPCGSGSPWDDDFCKGCEYQKEKDCHSAKIATHLLANGIIVPPVKLSQTVYTIQGQRKYPKEWAVVGIWKSKEVCNFHMVCYIDGKFEASASMDEDLIGKSVFLTKEEAIEALKARDNK